MNCSTPPLIFAALLAVLSSCSRMEAVITASPIEGPLPLVVDFSAADSVLPAGEASYQWDFGAGETGTGAQASHTFLGSGPQEVWLTVSVEDGGEWESSVLIDVQPGICPGIGVLQVLGALEADEISETSGLAESRQSPGVLWVHNDSGDSPRFFAVSTTGRHLGTYTVAGAARGDWEDLAIGQDPQTGEPVLYLGDIGDNPNNRDEILVYRVPEPAVAVEQDLVEEDVEGDTLHLVYPDGQSLNAETLMVDPVTEDLYVVSKDYGGMAGIWCKAAPHADGDTATLELVAELDFEAAPLSGGATTGGEVSPLGDRIAIRTYASTVFVWLRDGKDDFSAAFAGEPCAIAMPWERQAETLAFGAQGEGLLSISEGLNPDINFLPFE